MTDEELRRRRMQDAARGAGPAASPAASGGRPERAAGLVPPPQAVAAPAAPAGIAPAPKYGSLSFTRPDGSRYEVSGNQASNIVPAAGGLFRVPSATAPGQTANFDSRVPDDPARRVAPLAAAPGMEIRRAPATGAEVQMPADAWDRRDAAVRQRAGGGGIVQPAPGDTAAYAGAAGQARSVLGAQGPALDARGRTQAQADMQAGLFATRGLRWNQSGPTSAVNRAVGLFHARAAEEAEAARRREFQGGLVRDQLAAQQQLAETETKGKTDLAGIEWKGRSDVAGVEAGADRDVAGTQAGAVKYGADKTLEGARITAEAGVKGKEIEAGADLAVGRAQADAASRAAIHEMDLKYGQNKAAMSDAEIGNILGDRGQVVREARAIINRNLGESNKARRRNELDALARKILKGEADGAYLESLVDVYGPYVDLQDQRAGVGGAGAGGAGARFRVKNFD